MLSYPQDFNPRAAWRSALVLVDPLHGDGREENEERQYCKWGVREVQAVQRDGNKEASSAVGPAGRKRPNLWGAANDLWKSYCKYSTVHGIRFAAADDVSYVMRIFWAVALIGSACMGFWICNHFFNKARKYPTVVRVAEDQLELYNVVFPGVAFCPSIRVRASVANEYIAKHLRQSANPAARAFLNLSQTAYQRQVNAFVIAMSHYEVQFLRATETPFTKSQKLLAALQDINITHFMVTTLPTCEEIFDVCSWHGDIIDCCKEMTLQQSPIGFCYSFNSLTSLKRKHCARFPESGLTVEQSTRRSLASNDPVCQLHRTTGFGLGSGLRVQIKGLNQEYLTDGVDQMMMVGSFARIRPNLNLNLMMAIYLDNTEMAPDVAAMGHEVTHCLGGALPADLLPRSVGTYTYTTCKFECRLDYMKSRCGCYPYFIGGEPQCKTTDLLRCTRLCKQIHWQLPPETAPIQGKFGNLDYFGINCTKCIPRCQVLTYYPEASLQFSPLRTGLIDIFYRDLTAATLYRVDRSYANVDIATYLGSIAGLCLGCSILSLLEILFYLAKLVYLLLAGNQHSTVFGCARKNVNEQLHN